MLLSTLKNLAVLLALGWSSSHSLLTSAMKPPGFLDAAASCPSSRQHSDHVAASSEAGSSVVDSLDLSSVGSSWVRVAGSSDLPSVGTSWVRVSDLSDVANSSDFDNWELITRQPHVTLIYVLWDISGSTQDYWKAAFDYLPRMVSDFLEGPQSVGKKYPETKMLLTLDCFNKIRSKRLDWVDMRQLKTEIVHAPFRREATSSWSWWPSIKNSFDVEPTDSGALPVVVPGSAKWEEVAALPDEERKMWVGFEGNLAGLAWDAENKKHYVPREEERGAAHTKNQGWFVPDMSTRLRVSWAEALKDVKAKINEEQQRLKTEDSLDDPKVTAQLVVVTDGEDNESKNQMTEEMLKKLNQEASEKSGIDIIFAAANQDAKKIGKRLGAPEEGILNFTVDRAAAAGGALSNGMQRAVERRAELLHAASLAKKKAKPTVPWTAVTVEGKPILSDFGFAGKKGTTVKQIREMIGRRLRTMGMMGAVGGSVVPGVLCGAGVTLPRVYVESTDMGKVLPDNDSQTLESLVKLHDLAAINRQGRIVGRCRVVQFRVVVPVAASAEKAEQSEEEIFAKQKVVTWREAEELKEKARREAEQLKAKTTVLIVDGDDHEEEDHSPPPLKSLFTTAERASASDVRDDDEEDMHPLPTLLRRSGAARHVPSNGSSSALGTVPEDAELPTKKPLDLPEIPRLDAVEEFHRPWLQAFQAIGSQSTLPEKVKKACGRDEGGFQLGGGFDLRNTKSEPPFRSAPSCQTGEEEDEEDNDLSSVPRMTWSSPPQLINPSTGLEDNDEDNDEEEDEFGGYPCSPPSLALLVSTRTCPHSSE